MKRNIIINQLQIVTAYESIIIGIALILLDLDNRLPIILSFADSDIFAWVMFVSGLVGFYISLKDNRSVLLRLIYTFVTSFCFSFLLIGFIGIIFDASYPSVSLPLILAVYTSGVLIRITISAMFFDGHPIRAEERSEGGTDA